MKAASPRHEGCNWEKHPFARGRVATKVLDIVHQGVNGGHTTGGRARGEGSDQSIPAYQSSSEVLKYASFVPPSPPHGPVLRHFAL